MKNKKEEQIDIMKMVSQRLDDKDIGERFIKEYKLINRYRYVEIKNFIDKLFGLLK